MPTLLGIVGASVRAAAASAVRAGLQPVAADRFGDEDLRLIAPTTRIEDYPRGLLDWLRQLDPRPAAWMYVGALENHPDLVDTMAAICPLWGNDGQALQQVRSPCRLAEALGEAGLLFPETRVSSDRLPRDGSWLVKTGRGAGGSGVKALLKDDDGATGSASDRPRMALAEPVAPSGHGLQTPVYQQRVAGQPCSAVFVAAAGTRQPSAGSAATLLGVVRQLVGADWLGAAEFQYCGAIGPFRCAETTFDQIERIGSAIADRFRLVGLFGVDLVIDDRHVWTIEVNPRYTASVEVVERATRVRAIAAHVVACRQNSLDFQRISHAADVYGKAIIFAKRSVTISAEFVDWAVSGSRVAAWPSVADISPAGTTIDATHPVITVIASGATDDRVEEQLRDRVAEIERALYGEQPVSE